jgi:hypothetical protein
LTVISRIGLNEFFIERRAKGGFFGVWLPDQFMEVLEE